MDSDLDGIVSYKDFRRWIKMGDPTGRGSSQVLRLVSSAILSNISYPPKYLTLSIFLFYLLPVILEESAAISSYSWNSIKFGEFIWDE